MFEPWVAGNEVILKNVNANILHPPIKHFNLFTYSIVALKSGYFIMSWLNFVTQFIS